MLFADLGVVTNRAERLEASVKKPRPDREAQLKELDVVRRVLGALEAAQTDRRAGLTEEEKKPMRSFGLLTDKPQVVLVNAVQGGGPRGARALAPEALAIDAKLELELAQLEPDERAAFMADLGITELGRDRIIRRAYDAVGIITFFTAGSPRSAAGTSSAAAPPSRPPARSTPTWPGLHPRRGHRLRRPGPPRLDEGGQGPEPPTPRGQGLRRQGRRRRVFPPRA